MIGDFSAIAEHKEATDKLFNERVELACRLLRPELWRKKGSYWELSRDGRRVRYDLSANRLYIQGSLYRGVDDPFLFLYKWLTEDDFAGCVPGKRANPPTGGVNLFPAPYDYFLLTPRQKKLAERYPPPREVLEKYIGYAPDLDLLYYLDEEGDTKGYESGAWFVGIDGTEYAAWRVKSQIMLGNPHGVASKHKLKDLAKIVKPFEPPQMDYVTIIGDLIARLPVKDRSKPTRYLNMLINELHPGTRRRPY